MSRTITHITPRPFGHHLAKGDKLAGLSGHAAYALAILQERLSHGSVSLDHVYRVLLRAMEMHHIEAALAELEAASLVKRGYREQLVGWRDVPTASPNGGTIS